MKIFFINFFLTYLLINLLLINLLHLCTPILLNISKFILPYKFLCTISLYESLLNGISPVNIKNNIIPVEYTSIFVLYYLSYNTSGATKPGVPQRENN